jgi:hypothetical protein
VERRDGGLDVAVASAVDDEGLRVTDAFDTGPAS